MIITSLEKVSLTHDLVQAPGASHVRSDAKGLQDEIAQSLR